MSLFKLAYNLGHGLSLLDSVDASHVARETMS